MLRLGEAVDDPPFPIMVYLVVPRRERKPLPAAEPLDVLVEPETLTSLVVGRESGRRLLPVCHHHSEDQQDEHHDRDETAAALKAGHCASAASCRRRPAVP